MGIKQKVDDLERKLKRYEDIEPLLDYAVRTITVRIKPEDEALRVLVAMLSAKSMKADLYTPHYHSIFKEN